MNDFTKEELEQIYYHMENEPQQIMDKVKSMIENYCEHEFIFTINDSKVRCYRCEKVLND